MFWGLLCSVALKILSLRNFPDMESLKGLQQRRRLTEQTAQSSCCIACSLELQVPGTQAQRRESCLRWFILTIILLCPDLAKEFCRDESVSNSVNRTAGAGSPVFPISPSMHGWLLESGRWFEVSWCFHCSVTSDLGSLGAGRTMCVCVWGCDWECQSLWGHSPCDSTDEFPNGPVMQWLQPYLEAWLLRGATGLVHGLGEPTPGLHYFSESRNLCVSTMGSEISVFINHRLGMRVFSWDCINPFSGMTILGSVSCQWCFAFPDCTTK